MCLMTCPGGNSLTLKWQCHIQNETSKTLNRWIYMWIFVFIYKFKNLRVTLADCNLYKKRAVTRVGCLKTISNKEKWNWADWYLEISGHALKISFLYFQSVVSKWIQFCIHLSRILKKTKLKEITRTLKIKHKENNT